MRLFIVYLAVLLLSSSVFSGVVKETKSSVTFKGFGKYVSNEMNVISGNKKFTEVEQDFEGEGFLSDMVAKLFVTDGKTGDIYDLDKMQMIKLYHKDREYSITPIVKVDFPGANQASNKNVDRQPQEEKESPIREIRTIFKVTATGEKKKINTFDSEKYTLLWLREWENTESGEQGTDSLFTTIWTTELNSDQKKAMDEEMAFNKKYMESIGMETNKMYNDILGTSWMSMFSQLNTQSKEAKNEEEKKFEKFAGEMEKLKGHPILIDGNYYMIRPAEKKEQEEKIDYSNPGSIFSSFAKKVLKKDKPKKLEPAFSYYTETLRIELQSIADEEFSIPTNYKNRD